MSYWNIESPPLYLPEAYYVGGRKLTPHGLPEFITGAHIFLEIDEAFRSC